MNLVKINIDYLTTVNYSLCHNCIPVCQAVTVTNISDLPLEDVKVVCEGEFITRFESDVIAVINPGETVRVAPFEISPNLSKLASLTEKTVTSFTVKALRGAEIVSKITSHAGVEGVAPESEKKGIEIIGVKEKNPDFLELEEKKDSDTVRGKDEEKGTELEDTVVEIKEADVKDETKAETTEEAKPEVTEENGKEDTKNGFRNEWEVIGAVRR